MGALFIVFAVAMAVATFIENDHGSQASYTLVYNTRWFELILLLLAINLIGQMITFRLYRKEKLTVLLFHLSFVLMIAGAGVTRYFGWEGLMHIREGETARTCDSNERHLSFNLQDKGGNSLWEDSEKYSDVAVSPGKLKRTFDAGSKEYRITLSGIIPNATREIADNADGGVPMVSLIVTAGDAPRQQLVLSRGETASVSGISLGFDASVAAELRISSDTGGFFLKAPDKVKVMNMMTQEAIGYEPGERVVLKLMSIVEYRDIRIVPKGLSLKGRIRVAGVDPGEEATGMNAFVFDIFSEGKSSEFILWESELEDPSTDEFELDEYKLRLSIGSRKTELPFYLMLNDFTLERYPGSDSPSGYISDVVLIDSTENVTKPFRIFMNNVLKYKGYRFYQSSYDHDEQGTILSVSHDRAGILISYSGYALLFLFIFLSLLNKRSLFNTVSSKHWGSNLRKTVPAILIVFWITGMGTAEAQRLVPDKKAADEFGRVLVQDQKGRTKPLYTLSSDILRKVSRENKLNGMTPMQVLLGVYLDFSHWMDEPLIKISNKNLRQSLGLREDLAAFSDLVDLNGRGSYKLAERVSGVYSKNPSERTKEDKEIMKVDERVNIIYMIYTGRLMKLFPVKDGSHNWGSPQEALMSAVSREDSLYLGNVLPVLAESLRSGDAASTVKLAESVTAYQKQFSEYELPSVSKTRAEIIYYRLMIFERLFPYYATIGIVMLILMIVAVVRGKKLLPGVNVILSWLLLAGFLLHTFGLGLRWYVSGHSPMSNGYESMLFISWVTLLAGFVFSRKSPFTLPATAVLASLTLLVAHMSFMDPEITNLVPVLKSYWLTLHVSVVTASYGFLGLGAILGLLVMILMVFTDNRNSERISNTIDELTVINFKTLTLGLYFLTIGTFLGAIWANESWGRYWGWDPKETWSLITIIVYSFVIHSRLIPGMKDIYTFNLLSLFSISSVLMTYFGVNYYLSGLHSYAGGDPVPVPAFVYLTVIVLVILSVLAYLRYHKWEAKAT